MRASQKDIQKVFSAPKTEAGSKVLDDLFAARMEGQDKATIPTTPVNFIRVLRSGASGSVLKMVTQHIPKFVVVEAVGSDTTNFSKLFRKKHLSGKQTEELNDLTDLWQELRAFFNWDENLVKDWIKSPLPVLEGDSPEALLGSQYGRDTLRRLLSKMRFGEFA